MADGFPDGCLEAPIAPACRRCLDGCWIGGDEDFSMTPIFHAPGGIVRAAELSMAAEVDLILLSYDAEAVYDLLAAGLAGAAAR